MADIGGPAEQPPAMLLDRERQAGAIFQRMETALVGEFQRACSGRKRDWRVVAPFDIDFQLAAGVIFLFELGLVRTCSAATR